MLCWIYALLDLISVGFMLCWIYALLDLCSVGSNLCRITKFFEKPHVSETTSRLASVVFYIFRRQTCSTLSEYLHANPGLEERSFGKYMVSNGLSNGRSGQSDLTFLAVYVSQKHAFENF